MTPERLTVDFQLRRLLNLLCTRFPPFFERDSPVKVARVKLKDGILEQIDTRTGTWRGTSPPSPIAEITREVTDIRSGNSNPVALTHYTEPVRSPYDLPPPTHADLARFIVDNSQDNLLLQMVLILLSLCVVDIIRQDAIDVLTFLFFRYPHRERMRGVVPDGRPGSRSYGDILTNAGFVGVEDASNGADQFKHAVKAFLQLLLASLRQEVGLTDDDFRYVLPRPSLTAYGRLLTPTPPPNCSGWALESVNQHIPNCSPDAPHDSHLSVPDALTAISARMPGARPLSHASLQRTTPPLIVTRAEFCAALDYIGFDALPRSVPPPHIETNDRGMQISLPLTILPNSHCHDAHSLIPFAHQVNGSAQRRIATTPDVCRAIDLFLWPQPFPALTRHDGHLRLDVIVPYASSAPTL
jgi:hypothetical protein